jgi:hypothetical protein
MARRLYERKVSPGGRVTYEDTGTHIDTTGWPDGHYLVSVLPSSAMISRVDPAYVSFMAAARGAAEMMTRALMEANKGKPTKRENTEKEKLAWEAFAEAGGEMPVCFSGISMHDLVQIGIEAAKGACDLPEEYLPIIGDR